MVWFCEFLDGLYGILLYILAFVEFFFAFEKRFTHSMSVFADTPGTI